MKKIEKMEKGKKRALLLQVGACLDRCRGCHYSRRPYEEMCESCPTYERISELRKQLFPDRKKDFNNKQIQKILARGELINKQELEYLLYVKVPNRIIAEHMAVSVKELNRIIDSLGI